MINPLNYKVIGTRDAISAAVGCSLAARESLQERIPPYILPRRQGQTCRLLPPLKKMAGFF
jgi:hypothetical protein